MSLTITPICDFGKKANEFSLKTVDDKIISLSDLKGDKRTSIMFICNHCPYVLAVISELVKDCDELQKLGIKILAISCVSSARYGKLKLLLIENSIIFSKESSG